MTVFNLPDLGEGLPDAEIVGWKVKEGDVVAADDIIAELSTAKAVIELPSPFSGEIVRLHGAEVDVVDTGAPLITFRLEGEDANTAETPAPAPEPVPETAPKAAAASPKAAASPDAGGETFFLPDLGEGLLEAEIVQWMVSEGDKIAADEIMVEVSTDKAVVEIPAPFGGHVARLHGQAGDIVATGAALIDITRDGAPAPAKAAPAVDENDAATVVGAVPVGSEITTETSLAGDGIKASAAVRALARKLGVGLDTVKGSGAGGVITQDDIRAAAAPSAPAPAARPRQGAGRIGPAARHLAEALGLDSAAIAGTGPRRTITKDDVLGAARALLSGGARPATEVSAPLAGGKGVLAVPAVRAYARQKGVDLGSLSPSGLLGNVTIADVDAALAGGTAPSAPYRRPERPHEVSGAPKRLLGPRRAMARAMARANTEVCHTSIFDEADIDAWPPKTDITARIIRAIVAGAYTEPAMNAWFDGEKMELAEQPAVHVGVGVDSPRGLFVPVIRDADSLDAAGIRSTLQGLRQAIADQSIKTADMQGATITLSNFGMIAGHFATPIITPPEVAIVGIGGLFRRLVMGENGIANRRFMPVSLTFDHRATTGGEAARFLAAMIADLELAG